MVEPVPAGTPPIIIVGMHRSGTSFITEILHKLGMEIGWSIGHGESVFFHRMNRYLEQVCNCGWDNPKPMRSLLDWPEGKQIALSYLRTQVTSYKIAVYFGFPKTMHTRSLQNQVTPWGWKDPRNTFTIDFWRELFPYAKVIHIYRNGVDVAASLQRRAKNYLNRLASPYATVRCNRLSRGFRLWKVYIRKAFSILPDGGPEDILHVCYENVLAQPDQELDRLMHFCSLTSDQRTIDRMIETINPDRAFSFLQHDDLTTFYEKVKNDPWMARLGYDILSKHHPEHHREPFPDTKRLCSNHESASL